MGNEEQEALLEWLLSYELKLAARFRYYVALVYTKPTDRDCLDLQIDQLFENDMRDCDQYFSLGDNNAILMAHTSLEEAQQAIGRYKKVCNGTMDLRYSVAIYPNSPTAESMMETAKERLEKAVESQYGAVVDGG